MCSYYHVYQRSALQKVSYSTSVRALNVLAFIIIIRCMVPVGASALAAHGVRDTCKHTWLTLHSTCRQRRLIGCVRARTGDAATWRGTCGVAPAHRRNHLLAS